MVVLQSPHLSRPSVVGDSWFEEATQPQPPTFLFIFKFTISTSYISTISTSYITESSTQLRIRAMNINLRYKAKLISNHLTD
jgi:hypothetical protein